MPKIVLDEIEVTCESILDLPEVLKKELHEGEKKLQKIQEEERKLSRRLRKLQALLEKKPAEKKAIASLAA